MASGWWMHDLWERSPVLLSSWVFWVLLSVMLHELAHGWAALWQGDGTPREQGRMTWNPMVHMGIYSIVCLLLVGIAWGSMPTDPSRYRWGRQGRIVVSGAGPASNLLLAFLCWTIYGALIGTGTFDIGNNAVNPPLLENTMVFLQIGGMLNGLLAVFNMLPLPPFDGASVVAGFSRTYYRLMHDPRVQTAGIFIVLVALFSGLSALCAQFATSTGLKWATTVIRLTAGGG